MNVGIDWNLPLLRWLSRRSAFWSRKKMNTFGNFTISALLPNLPTVPPSVLDLSRADLEAWCDDAGVPRYRAAQIATWLYRQGANDFAAMNAVYAGYFSNPAPARATVQASRLPKDARIEIDVIAVLQS